VLLVREGEDQSLLLIPKGLLKADARASQALQDLDFALGVVRLQVLVCDDDFESNVA
jgi:hypothetical protein